MADVVAGNDAEFVDSTLEERLASVDDVETVEEVASVESTGVVETTGADTPPDDAVASPAAGGGKSEIGSCAGGRAGAARIPVSVLMLDAGSVSVIVPSLATNVPMLAAFSVALLRISVIEIPTGRPVIVTVWSTVPTFIACTTTRPLVPSLAAIDKIA